MTEVEEVQKHSVRTRDIVLSDHQPDEPEIISHVDDSHDSPASENHPNVPSKLRQVARVKPYQRVAPPKVPPTNAPLQPPADRSSARGVTHQNQGQLPIQGRDTLAQIPIQRGSNTQIQTVSNASSSAPRPNVQIQTTRNERQRQPLPVQGDHNFALRCAEFYLMNFIRSNPQFPACRFALPYDERRDDLDVVDTCVNFYLRSYMMANPQFR